MFFTVPVPVRGACHKALPFSRDSGVSLQHRYGTKRGWIVLNGRFGTYGFV